MAKIKIDILYAVTFSLQWLGVERNKKKSEALLQSCRQSFRKKHVEKFHRWNDFNASSLTLYEMI